jgi:hypothetical protein
MGGSIQHEVFLIVEGTCFLSSNAIPIVSYQNARINYSPVYVLLFQT